MLTPLSPPHRYIFVCMPFTMHVPASICASLAAFLIFWGIFRRLSWAVSLPAELFPYFFLTFPLPVALSPPRMPAPNPAAILPWAAPGGDASPGASWQRCPLSASSSAQELLALCVLMQQGAVPAGRKPPRKPQEHKAYGNEDVTNLSLGQPQLTQTVLSTGTAEGIFHVLSNPQRLFFRA